MNLKKDNPKGVSLPVEILNHIYGYLETGFWIDIVFDGRYPSKRNAHECSLIVMDAFWKQIIFRTHVAKKRKRIRKGKVEYTTSSVNLEGIALEKALNQIQNTTILERPIFIRKYFHDDDGKARGIISRIPYFEAAIEGLDKSHCIKNMTKKITNQIWKERIKKTVLKILKECNKNPEKIKEELDKWLLHWIGDHSKCKNCLKSRLLDLEKKSHKKLYDKLTGLFKKLKNRADLYKENQTTSLVESINRAILVGVDKNKDFPMTYDGRVDGQLSRLTDGELWLKDIFVTFKVPLEEKSIEYLDKKEVERRRKLQMARSQVSKGKKIASKASSRKRNATPSKDSVYYKENQKKKKKLEDEKNEGKKEEIVTEIKCKCKKGCKNNRCVCVKSASKCVGCGCIDCQNK